MLGASSSLNSGLTGIQSGLQQFQQSAQKIASQTIQAPGSDLGQLMQASVDMIKAEHQITASTAVVKASDEVLGSLLDVTV